jgi:Phosphotransferase enzyme family
VPAGGPRWPGPGYVKRRGRPAPGSIPEVLDIFRAEVRFYLQIAPVAGVRVPACYRADATGEGTVLVLEDLSAWLPGADPAAAARVLSGLHRRWEGQASVRWPWLRPAGVAADLVQDLFDRTWPRLAARGDLTPPVAALGARLAGRVVEAERAAGRAGPVTLVHGDASTRNMRTGPDGEVALLDWEDVSASPGVLDLAWLLVSSVAPGRWDEVLAAYGPAPGIADVLPAVIVQGLLSLGDTPAGSAEASAWIGRLEAADRRIGTARPA